jgi:hypothetical protein
LLFPTPVVPTIASTFFICRNPATRVTLGVGVEVGAGVVAGVGAGVETEETRVTGETRGIELDDTRETEETEASAETEEKLERETPGTTEPETRDHREPETTETLAHREDPDHQSDISLKFTIFRSIAQRNI